MFRSTSCLAVTVLLPPLPKRWVAAAAALAMVVWCPSPGRAVSLFTITAVTPLDSNWSWGYEVNNLGQVVGSHGSRGFLYSEGVYTRLGTLGGSSSSARAINDAGQIVGLTRRPGDAFAGFLYEHGSMTEIPTLGGSYSGPNDINNHGVIVGDSLTAQSGFRAFRYAAGVITDLGTLGGNYSEASGVNDQGDIVGMSKIANGEERAFLYRDGTMSNLGTLGGDRSWASDINNTGSIVGISRLADGQQRGFLWRNGEFTTIPTLKPPAGSAQQYSDARAINDQEWVVGRATNSLGHYRAYLYQDGQMWDLQDLIPPDSGWQLSAADSINQSGEIVGMGHYEGEMRAYLMTPVPEPSPIAVLLDIKPGSDPNSINLGSHGNIPVAIFSTEDFDATTVDPLTVMLAEAPVKLKGRDRPMASFVDLNADDLLDLLLHIETEGLELVDTDVEAWLTGETFDGTPISGVDSVRIVPPVMNIQNVPEPSTLILLSMGAVGLLAYAWRILWKLQSGGILTERRPIKSP